MSDKKHPAPSINQTMNRSPGATQIGQIINEAPTRVLSSDRRQALLEMLRSCPKGQITVMCQLVGNEPCDFATQLVSVLNDAGWDATLAHAIQAGQPAGLFIWVHDLNPPIERGVELQKALISIGFSSVPAVASPGAPADSLILFVSTMP